MNEGNKINLLLKYTGLTCIRCGQGPGADAINISGLLNPKKIGNFKNPML